MAMNLNEDLNATRGVTTFKVPLDKVIVEPGFNTRFDKPSKQNYERLKNMIRQDGQTSPAEVLVLPDRRVKLVDGHQRLQILQELEQEDGVKRTLLVIPFKGSSEDAVRRSIMANLGPTGLSGMDNVANWNRLINVLGDSLASVAKLYNTSEATITEGLKLLQLDRKHQQMVHDGRLSKTLALRLVRFMPEARDTLLDGMFAEFEARMAKTDAQPATTEESADAPVEAAPAAEPEPQRRSRTVRQPTEADLNRAAERAGITAPGGEAPRKMKELNTFFDEFIDETPAGDGVELVKDLRRFIARKLTDVQMANRILKYTKQELGEVVHDPKKDGSKKKK